MPKLILPLQASGPLVSLAVVDIEVGVSVPRFHWLRQTGQHMPPPVRLRGVLDSGAAVTVIDAQAIRSLGLKLRGPISILTPSTGSGSFVTNEYDASLSIVFSPVNPPLNLSIDSIAVVESDLSALGVGALLGVDVLAFVLFTYNGPKDRFALRF
jgi:hypothetical protein